MKILGMGMPELIIILIVALLLFGPKNLPKLGTAIGKTMHNMREGMDGAAAEASKAADNVVETVEDDDDYEDDPTLSRMDRAAQHLKRDEDRARAEKAAAKSGKAHATAAAH